jgi:signal transduction histidine kinase
MAQIMTSIIDRVHFAKWSIPVAIMAAASMLLISEVAYQNQRAMLGELVNMGKARVKLTYMLQRVTDAESGKRGYLLVGGQDYLAPYLLARQDVQRTLAEIHLMDAVTADPSIRDSQHRLESLFGDKMAEMDEVLKRYNNGQQASAIEMVRTGIGREIMEHIRAEFDTDMAHRNRLIIEGIEDVNDLFLLERIGIGSTTILSLIILVMFIRQGRTLLIERDAQKQRLQLEHDRLESEVERRTTQLKDLTKHLQTAREDERARLARDLHDELGALLTTAKLDVAVMRLKIQQSLPDLLPKLTHLAETLNNGISLKRRIIEDLCPSSLKALGLAASLESLLADHAKSNGLQVAHDLKDTMLTPDDQLTVYRLVQEAITNALKYAKASKLIVRLYARDGMGCIEFEDNGQGFDVLNIRSGSHGIAGMRFRVEAAGGTMHIESVPGEGTRVTACLPLCPPPPAEPGE